MQNDNVEKLKMMSKDVLSENIEKIASIFPNALVESRDGKKIDFDILKQELSKDIVDGVRERYHLDFPGKKEAIVEANRPITKTLRPLKEKSVDFDNTKNIYIEGDNLEALKILQESYFNKIKCIYIDPPYNTGNDFVYNDDFSKSAKDEMKAQGVIDENGNVLTSKSINNDSNGRYHSDWLKMMYPRLKLARNLLSDDGVIFISIDDREQDNLKKELNELFGESNFVAQVIWERAFSPVNLKKHFSESHDYVLCYAKNINVASNNGIKRSDENNSRYNNPDNDPRGVWSSSDLSVGPAIQNNIYEIITPSGRKVMPPSGYSWRLNKQIFNSYVNDNRIWFGENGDNVPRIKRFLSEVKQGITPKTVWHYNEVGHSQSATQKIKELFDNKAVFDYSKPVELLKRLIMLYSNEDSIIFDFFSGSATTAHAVMKLNAEDGGNRQFILVQLPEATDENSEAYKAGYKNICEIGEDRIKRASKKILEENKKEKNIIDVLEDKEDKKLDIGFRVFKVDESNMKDVFYEPDKIQQGQIDSFITNIKEDRTKEDLLIQVMLDMGLTLDLKIEEKKIKEKTIFIVSDKELVACFDEKIDKKLIDEIIKIKPIKVVLRESGFEKDEDKINYIQSLKNAIKEIDIRII